MNKYKWNDKTPLMIAWPVNGNQPIHNQQKQSLQKFIYGWLQNPSCPKFKNGQAMLIKLIYKQ